MVKTKEIMRREDKFIVTMIVAFMLCIVWLFVHLTNETKTTRETKNSVYGLKIDTLYTDRFMDIYKTKIDSSEYLIFKSASDVSPFVIKHK